MRPGTAAPPGAIAAGGSGDHPPLLLPHRSSLTALGTAKGFLASTRMVGNQAGKQQQLDAVVTDAPWRLVP